MIETIKSTLLLLLVGLSLLLTYQLWYGQKPTQVLEQDVFERIVIEQPRELEKVIDPQKIVLHDHDKLYIHKKSDSEFEQMWDLLSHTLQQIGSDDAVNEQEMPAESRKLLSYYMQPSLPVGEDQPWLGEASYSEIEKIYLFANNNSYWLVFANSDNNIPNLLLPPGEAEQFKSFLDEVQIDKKTAYAILTEDMVTDLGGVNIKVQGSLYVPVDTIFMSELNMDPEQLDQDLILKTFFVDYSMARVIEEKEGGLIYTDGEKGLRLTSTGLEFSSPQMEEGHVTSAYSDALVTSSSLISYHGGWPDDLRLSSLELTGWGQSTYYTAEWHAYYDGYPVYTDNPTLALFNDNGLIHYTRTVYEVKNPIIPDNGLEAIARWDDALEKAIALYKDNNLNDLNNLSRTDSLTIKNISLAYVIKSTPSKYTGKPVWLITIGNEQFFLSAFKLEPLREDDLF